MRRTRVLFQSQLKSKDVTRQCSRSVSAPAPAPASVLPRRIQHHAVQRRSVHRRGEFHCGTLNSVGQPPSTRAPMLRQQAFGSVRGRLTCRILGSSSRSVVPHHPFVWRGLCASAQDEKPPSSAGDSEEQKTPQTYGERFKASKLGIMWHKYGYVAIGTYGAVYVGTLALLYAGLSSQALSKGDALWMVKYIGLDTFFESRELTSSKGNFAVAWVLTKFTEPLRMGITIAIVPWITRRILGRREAMEEEKPEEREDGKMKEQ